MFKIHYFVAFSILFTFHHGQSFAEGNIGEGCFLSNGSSGNCRLPIDCPYALDLIKKRELPETCGFQGEEPIFCCPNNQSETTTEKCRYFTNDASSINLHLRKKRNDLTTSKPILGIDIDELAGGVYTAPIEFPYMALLGFGNITDIEWLCGGSLINERFIVTAAHCLYHRSLGMVSRVRLGELDFSSLTDIADPSDHEILKQHVHPDYNPIQHYHDIALLELKNPVVFNRFKSPACLYTEKTIPTTVLIVATGWGVTEFAGEQSSHLQKANLSLFNHGECNAIYTKRNQRNEKKLPRGIDDDIQICAGGRDEVKDTCPGDSGGPLQMEYHHTADRKTNFAIIGITSFGIRCGIQNVPRVYTRVYPYFSWIESIVSATR